MHLHTGSHSIDTVDTQYNPYNAGVPDNYLVDYRPNNLT